MLTVILGKDVSVYMELMQDIIAFHVSEAYDRFLWIEGKLERLLKKQTNKQTNKKTKKLMLFGISEIDSLSSFRNAVFIIRFDRVPSLLPDGVVSF